MRIASCLSILASAAVSLVYSSPAAASLSASAFGGFGFPPNKNSGDLFRLGYGARAGYTVPLLPLYFGASSTFHTGEAKNGLKTNQLSYHGLEFGADLGILSVGIKPYVFAGVGIVDSDKIVDGGFISPAVGLGVAPWYNIIDIPLFELFVSVDARVIYLTTQIDNGQQQRQVSSFPVYLQLGGRAF